MARINGIAPTFPYAADLAEAPYTDGTLVAGPTESQTPMSIGFPSPTSQGLNVAAPSKVYDYLGNTKCVYANQVWYPIFAGDF